MNTPRFSFFLVHKSGFRALGASHKQREGYVMFRIHHPDAQVVDEIGRRKSFEYVGGIGNDEIQDMIESGEWEIESSYPFEEADVVEVA
jgi:hypothetical protein